MSVAPKESWGGARAPMQFLHLCGVTLAPWQSGRLLVWDATFPDTFATSYRTHDTQEAGKVAENAEDMKAEKYWGLPTSHSFTPIALETMGIIDPRSMAFLMDLHGASDSHGVGKAEVIKLSITAAICDCTEGKLLSCGGHERLTDTTLTLILSCAYFYFCCLFIVTLFVRFVCLIFPLKKSTQVMKKISMYE